MIAEDGIVVDLVGGQISVTGKVPCGYVYVDGLSVGEVTESSLKDRLILGDEGFISVVVVVDSTSGKLVAGPEIHARGSGIDDAGLAEVRPLIEQALAEAAKDGIDEVHQLAAAGAADHRPLGERQLPAAPDDHPGGHRGLIRPHAVPAETRHAVPAACSRSLKRCSLPVLVRGSESTNSMARGYL